jgi:hypothetical protein
MRKTLTFTPPTRATTRDRQGSGKAAEIDERFARAGGVIGALAGLAPRGAQSHPAGEMVGYTMSGSTLTLLVPDTMNMGTLVDEYALQYRPAPSWRPTEIANDCFDQ